MSRVSGGRGVLTYRAVGVYGTGKRSARDPGVPVVRGWQVTFTNVGVRVNVGDGPGVDVGGLVSRPRPSCANPTIMAPISTTPRAAKPPSRTTGLALTAAHPFGCGFSWAMS